MAGYILGGVVGAVLATIFLVLRRAGRTRYFGAMLLGAFTLFCSFGFLASFEPGYAAWKIAYALAGTISGIGTGWSVLPRRGCEFLADA